MEANDLRDRWRDMFGDEEMMIALVVALTTVLYMFGDDIMKKQVQYKMQEVFSPLSSMSGVLPPRKKVLPRYTEKLDREIA